jgi:ankyrin repeat protein
MGDIQAIRKETWALFDACHAKDSRFAFVHAMSQIEEGADVNARCVVVKINMNSVTMISRRPEDRLTPLFAACHSGHLDLVNLLLDRGAGDDRAVLAAVLTCWYTHDRVESKLEVARLLLLRGLGARCKTSFGLTALDAAVCSGSVAMSELLLANGARVEDCKWPPLLVVCRNLLIFRTEAIDVDDDDFSDHDEDAEEDKDCGSHRTLICAHDVSRAADLVRLLLDHGADADVFDDDGSSLVEMAIRAGNYEVAKRIQASKSGP